MKKILLLLLTIALTAALFCACGEKTPAESGNTTATEGTVRIDDPTATGETITKEGVMTAEDGSSWTFYSDRTLTVTDAGGTDAAYTYALTNDTLTITDKATGETVTATVEYEDDGSLTLFYDDRPDIILNEASE